MTPRRLKTERSKKHDAPRGPKTTAEDHVVERVSERFEEQVVEMPVPRLFEGVLEVAQTMLQERISKPFVEHIVFDVPVPQI